MMFNPDLFYVSAKNVREIVNCKHEESEPYGHSNRRCKKCGALFKVGFMEVKTEKGENNGT